MREVEIPQIVEWTQGQMDMRKQQWDKSEQTKVYPAYGSTPGLADFVMIMCISILCLVSSPSYC